MTFEDFCVFYRIKPQERELCKIVWNTCIDQVAEVIGRKLGYEWIECHYQLLKDIILYMEIEEWE